MNHVVTLSAVLVLCLVHLFVGRLRLGHGYHRSGWLSAAGGAAVAYVFVYLLPKLAAKQQVLMAARHGGLHGFLEHHVYLVALAGFVAYYGIDRAAELAKARAAASRPAHWVPPIRYLQVAATAAYCALVSYIIADSPEIGLAPLALFDLAMALHFLSADWGLQERFRGAYEWIVRWILVAATLLGWVIGAVTVVDDTTVALWTAFLVGCIIINVMHEELPTEQHSRFLPFLAGVASYTALLLAIETLK